MPVKKYEYIIIGGGLAGVSAVEGIREIDDSGKILLVGKEKDPPYDRPHLSKKLWFGKKKVDEIFIHDNDYFNKNNVELMLDTEVIEINAENKNIRTVNNKIAIFDKLLISTGGKPRKLNVPGGQMEEIFYFRTLEDYRKIRSRALPGKKAVVIGGGFIGSEIAAALKINNLDVAMIFPEDYIVQRVFPEKLGNAIQKHYIEKGINIINRDVPVSFEKKDGKISVKTKNGVEIIPDIVIAGVGIEPDTGLAERAGLNVDNGIVADEYLCSSKPGIYSAGDNTNFIMEALGKRMRLEHWDNSIRQGRKAGRNMAGAGEKFNEIPYFFSDLFEFGYEAAGEIDSRLDVFTDWKVENDTGVVYYMSAGRIRGVMLCNVWDKIETARDLIRKQEIYNYGDLKGKINF